jgi:hypothetical protein
MTEVEKPKDIIAYRKWLLEYQKVDIGERAKRYYETVMSKAIADIQKSDMWQELKSDLNIINQAYFLKTNYYLFVSDGAPELLAKPFESLVEKSFRKNVIENRDWPEAPRRAGWVLPEQWYRQVNDLVRTCFVVKYLDGVNFLVEELEKRARAAGYQDRTYFEAREEGYYAAHFYFKFPCEIPKENWDTREEVIAVELQVTTQLQEVIRKLLHKYYETQRSASKKPDMKWQWDYKSDEFAANYLGHILHYVEGMIMDVRDNKVGRGEEK